MHLAGSFCVVLLLHCVQFLRAVPLSNDYYGPINEVDGNAVDYEGENSAEEVKYVTAIARNKRSYNYPGSYSSESFEDNYGYYPKPTQYYFIRPYWSSPPPRRGNYGFWPPGHSNNYKKDYHGPNHHKKHCKYPNHHYHNHDSSEYEDNTSDEFPFHQDQLDKSTTTIRNFPKITTSLPDVPSNIPLSTPTTSLPDVPSNIPLSTPTSTPSVPPTTTSTSTTTSTPFTSIISSSSTTTSTTTESGPLFDVRNND